MSELSSTTGAHNLLKSVKTTTQRDVQGTIKRLREKKRERSDFIRKGCLREQTKHAIYKYKWCRKWKGNFYNANEEGRTEGKRMLTDFTYLV
jgi:hypothetical protein